MKLLLFILLLTASGMAQTLTGGASISGAASFSAPGSGGSGASTKARQFNGTSDYLNSASSLSLSAPGTISIWFRGYWNTFANDDKFFLESSTNGNSTQGAFYIDPDFSGDGSFAIIAQTGAGGLDSTKLGCEFTRPSGAAWHSYLFVISLSVLSCEVWVDGTSQTISTVPGIGGGASATTFTDQTWYFMSRAGSALFGAGRISDITIWTADVSANVATLNNCSTDPSTIDAANQKFYWPIKQTSPETPTTGAVNLTVTGTTNVASACP